MTTTPFRAYEPKTSPAMTICHPCDRCGAKERGVSIYAAYEAHRQYGAEVGYFPSRSFRLCEGCLRGALSTLGGDT